MKKLATLFIALAILAIMLSSGLYALPSAPSINYGSNSTANVTLINRSTDAKGTITVMNLSATQQSYRWKAYVGEVTGKVALDNAAGQTIYDWDLGTSAGGEVYASRYSSLNFATITCANSTSVLNEQNNLSIGAGADNISSTFSAVNHASFIVNTFNISGCRSAATYVNDAAQTMGPTARFQEILLQDNTTAMVYVTLMESNQSGYDNTTHDFQLIVAENESATVPTNYYFWVELG